MGAYTRALKNEKTLSPPLPVGGGAVDTNDWCITLKEKRGGGVLLGCGWKLPVHVLHLWQTKHFGIVTDSEL